MAIPRFPLKLVTQRMLAPGVGEYGFVRGDGQVLDFKPGQFIQIHFNHADGSEARRSYSLASRRAHAPEPDETIEITVSFVPGGAATALFESLQAGDSLDASGPFGLFCLRPGDVNRRYLLIGTGTGIAPYRAMLPLLERQIEERGIEVLLLAGARGPDQLIYADEFRAFADAHPRFRLVPCYSRTLPEPGTPQVHAEMRHGYVQQYLAEFAPNPATDIAYLCGNPDMVDACFESLKAHGLPLAQIRREKYVSSK